ncbi:MAG: hypothetical protein GX569_11055 [Candidatus Riflebacteria bacterium]|nr:hypothetical protein [Candidatus Riflebacteria bacterium]
MIGCCWSQTGIARSSRCVSTGAQAWLNFADSGTSGVAGSGGGGGGGAEVNGAIGGGLTAYPGGGGGGSSPP